MNRFLKRFAVAGVAVGMGLGAHATVVAPERESSPLAVAIVPAIECPNAATDVLGFRLGLFASEHANVSMIDLNGLAGFATGTELGLQISGLYSRVGDAAGTLQLSGLANDCRKDFVGGQLAALYNRAGGTVYGFSLAAVTSAESLHGLQIGLVNRVKTLEGLQIGVVNYADESEGLQIGVINVMRDGRYPVMPLVNFGF